MTTTPIQKLVRKCRDAAPHLATLETHAKNLILRSMADHLRTHAATIIRENKKDLKNASKLSSAMQDRLLLNEERINDMARGLEEVAKLPDPVGAVVKDYKRPNGLQIKRVRIPLGVVAVVYESRPNVTVDAAGLCFKSGNAVVLRGGSEAIHSNRILGKLLQDSLKKHGVPVGVITVVPTTDRSVLKKMLSLSKDIDVIIPRGGASLMQFMEEHSKIPIIKHDKGVCSLFVDETAHVNAALDMIENGKVQRPGVCNALENVLIHKKIAATFLPLLSERLKNVELRGDPASKKIVKRIKKATEADWSTEYLELILAVKIVKDVDDAIEFIRKYGSKHTEAIVTQKDSTAQKFIRSLDSSCIMVNASTRFNDGGQLGLGAEIGISTSKLHAYGPMGLEELTTTRFVVEGNGHVRT